MNIDKHNNLTEHICLALAHAGNVGIINAESVKAELAKTPGKFNITRLLTLISPAAEPFIEQMATQARDLTIQRFGRTVQLYAPLYVSNFCSNSCLYCGYNKTHDYPRTRLSIEQALADADVIASEGFRHILLVSGEDPKHITVDYLCDLARKLRDKFSSISVEIYPMTTPRKNKHPGTVDEGLHY